MALAIDTTSLAKDEMRWVQEALRPRYHLYRACVHGTVVKDSSLCERVRHAGHDALATREALDWQADQDEDLDEAEVIHHLHQQGKSSPLFKNTFSQTERSDAITTLVTSCSVQSLPLLPSAQGTPLSSFPRISLRFAMVTSLHHVCMALTSNVGKLFRDISYVFRGYGPAPKFIGKDPLGHHPVVWHLQYDIVDLLSPRRLPTGRFGKRRRTTINPFHQMPAPPEQDSLPGNHPPEGKRFKGVRYRRERRRWAAEMKPPQSKDKVSFGEFKSQVQAARAIDAAFHYYGKSHLLNFPDTPAILSSRPSPAGVLDKEDKLRFVKEQVTWLASIASTLPASSTLLPPEIPESSSRGCAGDTLGFRSFSEITSFLSCGVADEPDDGISQSLRPLHPDALSELGGSASPFVGADALGSIIGTLEGHQDMLHWSLEDAVVAPSSCSSVHITHVVDESNAPALMTLANSAEPSSESLGSWMNCFAMSPPASVPPLPLWSPTSIHVDVTHGLLESEALEEENGSEADGCEGIEY